VSPRQCRTSLSKSEQGKLLFFFFPWWYQGLNSGSCTCYGGALPIEPQGCPKKTVLVPFNIIFAFQTRAFYFCHLWFVLMSISVTFSKVYGQQQFCPNFYFKELLSSSFQMRNEEEVRLQLGSCVLQHSCKSCLAHM
jgi:hypothetical protein